ncbi:hypothetical protein [Demequina subtropica]|uniref:hypothetical protein n=1 Tax=Demequina subtropica TaxID=1638989 RepID=UPI0007830546|nr:hypothetical protein [Demequina subtropica]
MRPIAMLLALAAALLAPVVGAPASAAAEDGADASAQCQVIAALGNDAAAVETAIQLFSVDVADPEALAPVLECVLGEAASPETLVATVCVVADGYVQTGRDGDARALIESVRASSDDGEACTAEYEATSAHATPRQFSKMWDTFVSSLLVPAGHVGLAILSIMLGMVVLARLLVLFPRLRDRPSLLARPTILWWSGLTVAVITAIAFVGSGTWVMRNGGPVTADFLTISALETSSRADLVDAVLAQPVAWWLLFVVLAALAVGLMAKGLACHLGIVIDVSKPEPGGELDQTRILEAMQGLLGTPHRRAVDIPSGTIVAAATEAVADLSENRQIAAAQRALAALFGQTPWRLSVDRVTSTTASITIARNGTVVLSRTMDVDNDHMIKAADRVSTAGRLAALVAAELLATIVSRYGRDLQPVLHGASNAESIVLHWLAATHYDDDPTTDRTARTMLEHAIDIDALNVSARAALDNTKYRELFDGPSHHHDDYLTKVLEMLDHEKKHTRAIYVMWPALLIFRRQKRWSGMGISLRLMSLRRIRGDAAMIRLLHAAHNARTNLNAGESGDITPAMQTRLDRGLQYRNLLANSLLPRPWPLAWGFGPRNPEDRRSNAVRYRLIILIATFRETVPGEVSGYSRKPPHSLTLVEKWKWRMATDRKGDDTSVKRRAREDAVFDREGPFTRDPYVAYSLLCHRAAQGWYHESADLEDIQKLLKAAMRDAENRRWSASDPELASLKEALPDLVPAEIRAAERREEEALANARSTPSADEQ